MDGPPPLRLAKGSHIVVPKVFDHDRGYIFQNTDRRIVFALPFADDFTLIGTTDENFTGGLDSVAPSADEVMYLCRAVNEYFREPVEPDQVVWAFAGVRSLYDESAGKDEPEDVTRDYHLALDERYGVAPVLTVYGGKITTHRRLAEDALDRIAHFFQGTQALDREIAAAGRRFPVGRDRHPGVADAAGLAVPRGAGGVAAGPRLRHAGRARARADAKKREDIAPFFGPLSAAEVRYLMKEEWARTADDVLWRRSKLGLKVAPGEKELLARFMAQSAS